MTRRTKDNLVLYALFSPVLIFILIFNYLPIYGLIIAFQNYLPGSNFFGIGGGVRWVGLKHFADFLNSVFFWRLINNTLVLSGMQLLIGFFVPIAFALLLNEVKAVRFKKYLQTASYLPYFISMVVVASMVLTLLSTDGLINRLAGMVGLGPYKITTDSKVFPWAYVITNIWKTFGWNSIIYLATIAGIDPTLYEAAKIDGANRFQQMRYVTIPSISNTIVILLIFAAGGLLNANTEFILLMYSPAIYDTSDVIGTYIFRVGLRGGQYSKATAIGLFMQVINFTILYIANAITRKVKGYSLW